MTKHLPLIVDLDGTLLLTDTLGEGVVSAVLRKPLSAFFAFFSLINGRVAFKRSIYSISDIDVEVLPERSDFLEFLYAEKRNGRSIYLVTAALQEIADRIAERFEGLFDGAYGSSQKLNLKGQHKLGFMQQRFPEGFVYAGDSRADIAVWKEANGIVLAGASASTQRALEKLQIPKEAVFEVTGATGISLWRRALRLHQWAKNLLLFVPLFLSGQFVNTGAWLETLSAFILMGLTASGTYLLNDLLDLSADRRHRSKRKRPLASGDLFILNGMIAAPFLVFGSLIAARFLSVPFAAGLVVYLVISLAYSFGMKRLALLDVSVLACLFTIRIALGALAINQPLSEWLMTFSMCLFFSLSMAKRHVEIVAATPGEIIRGRGYYAEDAPLTLGLGLSSAAASIVIMVLFLAESAFKSDIYTMKNCLWIVPGVIGIWLMRIWLLAHRGELDDDPVSFAVRDPVSISLAVVLGVSFLCAVFLGAL